MSSPSANALDWDPERNYGSHPTCDTPSSLSDKSRPLALHDGIGMRELLTQLCTVRHCQSARFDTCRCHLRPPTASAD